MPVSAAASSSPGAVLCAARWSVANQGTGASQLTSTPAPESASSARSRDCARGASTNSQTCGCCWFCRPKGLKSLPARSCRPAGSDSVVRYASSRSAPSGVNAMNASARA